MTCKSVVFPEPDGPTIETSSPLSIVTLTCLRGVDCSDGSVALVHFAELDRGGHDDATSTRIPGRRRDELTSTRLPLKIPVVTGTRVRLAPSSTATA